jgi:hypothetical protein
MCIKKSLFIGVSLFIGFLVDPSLGFGGSKTIQTVQFPASESERRARELESVQQTHELLLLADTKGQIEFTAEDRDFFEKIEEKLQKPREKLSQEQITKIDGYLIKIQNYFIASLKVMDPESRVLYGSARLNDGSVLSLGSGDRVQKALDKDVPVSIDAHISVNFTAKSKVSKVDRSPAVVAEHDTQASKSN